MSAGVGESLLIPCKQKGCMLGDSFCSQTERAREMSVPACLPPEHFGRGSVPYPFMLRTPSMNPANSYSLFYFPENVELLKADLEGRPAVKRKGKMETQTGAT